MSAIENNKMTTYYHGTTTDLASSIIENGFSLTDNDTSRFKGQRDYDGECLYAFINIDSAIDFICDQGHNSNEVVVIAFNVDNDVTILSDPEYDVDDEPNNAVILFGDSFKTYNVQIVWSQGQ